MENWPWDEIRGWATLVFLVVTAIAAIWSAKLTRRAVEHAANAADAATRQARASEAAHEPLLSVSAVDPAVDVAWWRVSNDGDGDAIETRVEASLMDSEGPQVLAEGAFECGRLDHKGSFLFQIFGQSASPEFDGETNELAKMHPNVAFAPMDDDLRAGDLLLTLGHRIVDGRHAGRFEYRLRLKAYGRSVLGEEHESEAAESRWVATWPTESLRR